MKIAAIHQPQYLPYLGFFHKMNHADVFVMMDTAQFQRRGVQHRNRIKTAGGAQWITVPVLRSQRRDLGGRSEQPTNEVKVDGAVPWGRKHLTALRLNYSRAPFFNAYEEEVSALLDRPWETLCDLNMATTRWVMETLGITTPITYLSELAVRGTGSELLIDACRAIGADHYLSGAGGRNYMDAEMFEDAGIGIIWQEFVSPRYHQLFPEAGFIQDLSIVDALFCCGLDAKAFLE
jgi:hypothetical protein